MAAISSGLRSCSPERHQAVLTAAKDAALCLIEYCRANGWAGYDPYDALNSRLLKTFPFLDSKTIRLALTQGNKRCPVNLRPLFLIPKTQSSKGIALFLSAFVKLTKLGSATAGKELEPLAAKLLALRSAHEGYSCWGYNFPWQSRTGFLPSGHPNIVCTTFAANSLLDLYSVSREPGYLETALSAAHFILDELRWQADGGGSFFTYTRQSHEEIHNANLLGAALLSRAGKLSAQTALFAPALEAARFSADKQREDGSWPYGEAQSQNWIDNFHTGYNLAALRHIADDTGSAEFDPAIRRGFDFYKSRFFRANGAPSYFHNATYPIDIHSIAQSIITLIECGPRTADIGGLVHRVLNWAFDNMRDPRGFFYYQKRRHYTVRISFMRWSQAWMLLALATFLEKFQSGPSVLPASGPEGIND